MRIVLGDYPHTRGLATETVKPLYSAFARMVRNLEFDVCEMALATYLQAREAGIPITLLPVVMIGGTHHGSLTRRPDGPELQPGELKGKRVGVRSYSQTTGLWVRGILREEYQVEASDVTWLTTEEPHVAQYESPSYVVRSGAATVSELVETRQVDAAVLGPRAVGGQGRGLVPLIPDADAAAAAWIARHATIPINHVVVIRDELLDAAPAIFRELKAAIEATAGERDDSPAGRAVAAGWSESFAAALRIAGRYAFEQELTEAPADVDAIEHEVSRAIA
jgi:4,5-dihydroxyphthalate decarboxylase